MSLSKNNLLIRKTLISKTQKLSTLLEPGFDFGTIHKDESPVDFFIVKVLNKMFSLVVSIENNIVTNDIHQAISLYRYSYELFLKVFFMFSKEEKVVEINNFFENKGITTNIAGTLSKIDESKLPPNFKTEHLEKYKKMSRFVHPNIESLNLHADSSDDQIFYFIVSNIKLTTWHLIEIVKIFIDNNNFKLESNINKEELERLQIDILKTR